MKKNIIKLLVLIFITIIGFLAFYLFALPKISTDVKLLEWIVKSVEKNMNAELVIQNPYLETSIKPEIKFSIEFLSLKKDGELLLNLKNIDTKINFYKILQRKISIEKLGADEIYANVNELQNLKIKDSKKKKGKPFFKPDFYDALLYIKNLHVQYTTPNQVKMKLLAKDLKISDSHEPKTVHFKVFLDLFHKNEHLRLLIKDWDRVYFKDRQLHADDIKFLINKSEVAMNLLLDEKNHFDFKINSDKFEIDNIRRFLNTDLLMPNSHEFVACFKDFTGDFKFKVNITDKDLKGYLKVNKVGAKLIPVADLPLNVTKGLITINSNDIELKDFEGFYGSAAKNIIKMTGVIKDYTKTSATEINVEGTAYDEFAKYLSKIAGMKINVINNAFTDFKISFANGTKMDILGKIKVPKGSDVLFEGSSISPNKYLREFDINMDLLKDILSINNIDYHIVDGIKNQKPLITVNTKVNVTNGAIKELGFNIPEPLPSEFFNVLVGQTIFRRGTFAGNMQYINDKNPHIDGEMNLKDTFIVGQGMIIKDLKAKTIGDKVKITSEGFIRRTKYKFDTTILNKIVFPVIVTDTNLNFDEIDIEKVLQTFAPRPQQRPQGQRPSNAPKLAQSNVSRDYFEIDMKKAVKEGTNENVQVAFEPNLIEIQKGKINIEKGAYKKMTFGNLHADLSLTRKGILEIKSNKFDLTDGISTLKVYCDLARQKYFIRLGAKDVDTDAIATSILNLNKEITGHAKALIELNSDESMKLNGKIKFEVTDGSIAKLGLVQYVLNMASVFRNPLAMVSPASFIDIVDIPDGAFKNINGTIILKNNSIKGMMIQSSSPQLSSFIVGRINLENMDASLRIYTKFNDEKKGIYKFLREISLNSLAQRASSYTKGENESYYAAEMSMLPPLETGEDTAKIFITKFDGDIQSANFISSLKKIK